MRAVFRHLGKDDSIDPKVGGKFMGLAFRGFRVRETLGTCEADQAARGEALCELLDEADREAWLFGYRFEPKEEGT